MSGRQAVNVAIIRHLHKTWDLMKDISFCLNEARKLRRLSRDSTKLENAISQTYALISREVYSFGYAASRARFMFWMEKLSRMIRRQPSSPSSPVPLLEDFSHLYTLLTACHLNMNHVEQGDPSEQSWDDFIYSMDRMTKFAIDILRTPGLCKKWATAFEWEGMIMTLNSLIYL